MDDDIWGGWDSGYRRVVCLPGGAKVWEDVRGNWAPSFVEHVDQAAAECETVD
jgi:hypothetical protein